MTLTPDCQELLDSWPLAGQFELVPGDTVIVAGAYKGRVCDLLSQLYPGARLYGFEPQRWAADVANERTKYDPNVLVLYFGLGVASVLSMLMGEFETDACSFVNTGEGSRRQGVGDLMEVGLALDMVHVTRVSLAVLNMEGYEFPLLAHMIKTGLIDRFDRLAVQFHFGFGNDGGYAQLMDDMAETHDLVYDDRPSWGYWTRRVMERAHK